MKELLKFVGSKLNTKQITKQQYTIYQSSNQPNNLLHTGETQQLQSSLTPYLDTKNVFKCLLNLGIDLMDRISGGSEFHKLGPQVAMDW